MNMKKTVLSALFAAIGATSFNASANVCNTTGSGGCDGKGVDFRKIEASNYQSAAPQLDMQLRDATPYTPSIGPTVAFTFENIGSITSFITNIYFDDVDGSPLFSDIRTWREESGGDSYVKFARDSAYTSLPDVVDANFGFATNYKFSSTKSNGVATSTSEHNALTDSARRANGIANSAGPIGGVSCGVAYCVGEFYTFYGVLSSGKTLADVNAAINNGTFQIGLNVVSYASGAKVDTTYLSKTCPQPSTVPLPTAAWLFGSALIGFISVSNRRRI